MPNTTTFHLTTFFWLQQIAGNKEYVKNENKRLKIYFFSLLLYRANSPLLTEPLASNFQITQSHIIQHNPIRKKKKTNESNKNHSFC